MMTSELLKRAAARAGVTEEQAMALVRELSVFTHGMANAGDIGIPPFSWPEEHEALMREFAPGWEGLTSGEYSGTRAAVIWCSVCEYLMRDRDFFEWEAKEWEHPKSPSQT